MKTIGRCSGWRVAAALIAALWIGGPLTAQEEPTTDAPAAEADPSLDELLELPGERPPARPATPLDQPVDEKPAGEAFEQAIAGMQLAAQRLGAEQDPGIETQRIQERVIRQLDSLISQARKQKNQQRSQARQQDRGSQQEPGDPQGQQEGEAEAAGTEAATQAGSRGQVRGDQGADQPLHEQFGQWGNLPPRVRDALREGYQEDYSDLYEWLTEQYYRRLGEEGP